MTWTAEREKTLEKHWLDGLSASQISYLMPGFTRNAVIGKAHRLGLPKRISSTNNRAKGTRVRSEPSLVKIDTCAPLDLKSGYDVAGEDKLANRAVMPANSNVSARSNENLNGAECEDNAFRIEAVFDPDDTHIKIMTLRNHSCKWPIGDPGDENFHFCNGEAIAGKSYCHFHHKMAYCQTKRRSDIKLVEELDTLSADEAA